MRTARSHELTWLLAATPTGRSELRAGAGLTYSHLNSINPLAATSALNPQNMGQGFVPVPAGSVTYMAASASANGFYRPDGVTTWSELTSVTSFVPISGDAGRSLTLVQGGHFERLWGRNGLTLDLLGTYFRSTAFTYATGTVQVPGTETVQLQALAGWRHEFSPALLVSASAGVLLIDSIATNQLQPAPAAIGRLHYETPDALTELVVTQSSQLNAYLGQPLLIDEAAGRAVIPLGRLQWFRVVGAGTAQRSWTITPSINAAVDLLAADVGLAFTPPQRPFYASLDYLVQQQVGHSVGTTSYPSLHRQIVMLTLTATWGTDPAFH